MGCTPMFACRTGGTQGDRSGLASQNGLVPVGTPPSKPMLTRPGGGFIVSVTSRTGQRVVHSSPQRSSQSARSC